MRLAILLLGLFSFVNLQAENYYWVGGSGDWAEYFYHWAYESGGNPPEKYGKVPGPEDNVIFDDNSFGAGEDTLYVTFSSAIVCRDLDFSKCTKPIVFGDNQAVDIRIYGSMTLNRKLDLNLNQSNTKITFSATSGEHTIATAGNKLTSVFFDGEGGKWTLQDSLITTGSNSKILAGHLNTNSQYLIFNGLQVEGDKITTLELGNSTIDIPSQSLRIINNNLTIIPGTSTFRLLSIGAQTCTISTNQSLYNLYIENFKSVKHLDGNAKYNKVSINGNLNIRGSNSIDSLLFTQGYTYLFQKETTQTINKYFEAEGNCKSYIAISSLEGTDIFNFQFNEATANIQYAIIQDCRCTSNNTLVAHNSVDLGDNSGINIETANPRTLFWTGKNSIYWDDADNWSETSGGNAACVPTPYDNVVFDKNSFIKNDTVCFRTTTTFCRDFDWASIIDHPVLISENNAPINIFGSMKLHPNLNFQVSSNTKICFRALDAAHTITTAGNKLTTVIFDGEGGKWILQDSLITTGSNSKILAGHLNTNSQYLIFNGLLVEGDKITTLELGNSTIDIPSQSLRIINNNLIIIPGTSTFRLLSIEAQTCTISTNQSLYNLYIENFKSVKHLDGNAKYNKVSINGNLNIRGSNSIDSLLFTQGYTYLFQKETTQTINKYFEAEGNCKSYIAISSLEGTDIFNFQFNEATANIQYAIIQDCRCTSNNTLVAHNSVDLGDNSGINIETANPRTLFWTGKNSIYWDDADNWSETSGGNAACVPTPYDNVVFDKNSFIKNDTVCFRTTTTFCRDFDWASIIDHPVLISENNAPINIFGSMKLHPNLNFQVSSNTKICFRALDAAHTITTAGNKLTTVIFDGEGGKWILQDSLITTGSNSKILAGHLNTNSQYLIFNGLLVEGDKITTLELGNSTIDIPSQSLRIINNNLIIIPGTSTFRLLSIEAQTCTISTNQSLYNLYIENFKSVKHLDGNATFNKITLDGDITVRGSNATDSLILAPGYTYLFKEGTTQTVNEHLGIYGNNCYPIVMQSISEGKQATIHVEEGEVSGDFLELRDIAAEGNADFYAGNNSTDLSGNTGWYFTNSPKYVYGFGEDRVFCLGDTLFTQYFHNPERYQWDDGSDKSYRIIDGPGDYWVVGYYGEKCFWSDTINVNIINLYADNVDNMTLIENAYHADTTVILTPDEKWQFGGMWYQTQVAIAKGFETEFSFVMHDGVNEFELEDQPGADGFAFIIQNYTNNELGKRGGGLGFEGMPNCFAVEFDSYYNAEDYINDPSENHLAVFCNGTEPNLVNHNSDACLGTVDLKHSFPIRSDGTVYFCKIEYDYNLMQMYIWLDTTQKYTQPMMTLNDIDLSEMMELKQDEFAWVGFASATGNVYEKHEILSWYMCPTNTMSVLTGISEGYGEPENYDVFASEDIITISPNPMSGSSKVDLDIPAAGTYYIEVSDIFGKIVFSKEQDLPVRISTVMLNISEHSAGTYFFKISNKKHSQVKKFVLVK